MADDKWGAGPKKNWKPLKRYVTLGSPRDYMVLDVVPLVAGEHPHSRNDRDHYALVGDSDHQEAVGFSGNGRPVRIEVTEYNYYRGSGLSGDEIRQMCELKVYAQEIEDRELAGKWFQIYQHHARTNRDVLIWWLAHEHFFNEHAIDFWRRSCRERVVTGEMKVWWQNQPGVVSGWIVDQGCVIVKPDGKPFVDPGFMDPSGAWDGEWVKDDLLSPHIRWHRDV